MLQDGNIKAYNKLSHLIYLILFRFGTTISLDAKTCSVPQFIGASQRNFKTVDLHIESLAPLALDGWVNASHTLVLATKTIHRLRPPRTEES